MVQGRSMAEPMTNNSGKTILKSLLLATIVLGAFILGAFLLVPHSPNSLRQSHDRRSLESVMRNHFWPTDGTMPTFADFFVLLRNNPTVEPTQAPTQAPTITIAPSVMPSIDSCPNRTMFSTGIVCTFSSAELRRLQEMGNDTTFNVESVLELTLKDTLNELLATTNETCNTDFRVVEGVEAVFGPAIDSYFGDKGKRALERIPHARSTPTSFNETGVHETSLNETIVNETSLNETSVNDTSFNETIVNETSCNEASFNETSLNETSVNETILNETLCTETLSNETSVHETNYNNSSFDETIFNETTFNDTDFNETSFDGTSFDGTSFNGTNFNETSFNETSFNETETNVNETSYSTQANVSSPFDPLSLNDEGDTKHVLFFIFGDCSGCEDSMLTGLGNDVVRRMKAKVSKLSRVLQEGEEATESNCTCPANATRTNKKIEASVASDAYEANLKTNGLNYDVQIIAEVDIDSLLCEKDNNEFAAAVNLALPDNVKETIGFPGECNVTVEVDEFASTTTSATSTAPSSQPTKTPTDIPTTRMPSRKPTMSPTKQPKSLPPTPEPTFLFSKGTTPSPTKQNKGAK